MSGGGSSGQQHVTSDVTQTNLPAYIQPYYENTLQRGLFESARPYQPFTGQRMAQFAPEETAAQQSFMGMGRPGQFQTATDMATRAGQGPSSFGFAQSYNPTQFSPGYQAGRFQGQFNPGSLADPNAIAQYMSPYQQAVTDVEKREAARISDRESMNIGSQAARFGAVGGNRSAILEAERQRSLGQQLGDIQTRGSQSAFDRAGQLFEADRAGRLNQAQFGLGAFQANEQALQTQGAMNLEAQARSDAARQARMQFGLQGLNQDSTTGLASAELLANIGATRQEADLNRFSAQAGVGAQRRGLMQQGLDLGYEDFLRQQAYPREQLGFMSGLLHGVPVTPGSTAATFGRVPTAEQQLLGGGLNALGLYRAFNQPPQER